jgi:hypothetical protein
MKRKITLLASLALGLFTSVSFGQLDDLSKMSSVYEFAKGDASMLLSGYLKPFGNGFSAGLNNGWYNTAKIHKLLGFDITVNASVAMMPSSEKTFDVSSLNGTFSSTNISGRSSTSGSLAPTIIGSKNDGPTLTYDLKTSSGSYQNLVSFKTPGGVDFNYVPVPVAQIGIGLIKKTEFILRLVPKRNINDIGSVSLFGFGFKHSISQWVPVLNDLKFINVSALFGYTKLKISADAGNNGLKPSDYNVNPTPDPANPSYANQAASLEFSGWTLDAIASLDVPVITLFTGFGISPSKSSLKLTGNFPMLNPSADGSGNVTYNIKTVTDPFDIRINDKGIKPHITVGGKLKLFVLQFSASYTIAKYNMANVGVSLSIR